MSEKFVKEVSHDTINVKYNDESSLHVNHSCKTISCTGWKSETNNSYNITYSILKNGNKKIVVECASSTNIATEGSSDNNRHAEGKNTITCIKDPDDNITFAMIDDCNTSLTTELINNKVFPKSLTINLPVTNLSIKKEIKRDSLGRIVAFNDDTRPSTDNSILNTDNSINLSFKYEDENDNVGVGMGVVNNVTIRSVLVKNGSRVIGTVLYNDCVRKRVIIDYEGEIEKSRIIRISRDEFDDTGNIYITEESIREYPNMTTYIPSKITDYFYAYIIENKNARKKCVSSSSFTLEKEDGDLFGNWYNISYTDIDNNTFNLRINVNDDSELESYFNHNLLSDCLRGVEPYNININKSYTSLDLTTITMKGGIPYQSIIEEYSADSEVESSISSFTSALGSNINVFYYTFLSGEMSYINAGSLELSQAIRSMINNSSYFNLDSVIDKKCGKTEVVITRDQNDRICNIIYKDSEDMVANASYKYKDCDDTSLTLPTSIILSGQSLKTKTTISQELSVEYDDLGRIVKKEWYRQRTFPRPTTDTTEESNE